MSSHSRMMHHASRVTRPTGRDVSDTERTVTDRPGQRWPDCDADLHDFVQQTADALCERLGRLLVGVYLHGSLAMRSYRRPKSDIDLLVVVRGRLDPTVRGAVARL